MPFKSKFWARSACLSSAVLALVLFGSGREVFASGQTPATQQTAAPAIPPLGAAAGQTGPVSRLSADEAVRMALENNLGIQAERLSPQINTFAVAGARAAYAPVLFSNFFNRSSTQPPSTFITGAGSLLTTESLTQDGGLAQNIKWGGGNYSLSLSGGKVTTSAIDSRYNPQLSSN